MHAGQVLLAFQRAHGISAGSPPARSNSVAKVCPHRFGECDGENVHGDDFCPCTCAPCNAAVARLRARQVGL
jgi:hypothetical protein